jgi:small-conductance mechanosensitive channel
MLTYPMADAARVIEPTLHSGQLVILHLSDAGQVETLETPIPTILNLMKTENPSGFTPEIAQQEAARAEEWRQSLTLQTQELSRSRVEVETRRVQLQQIEESLKLERQELDRQRQEIEARMSELKALELASQKSNTP